jgi:hypothetical protein
MNYTPQIGDIFLCDSERFGAKLVKFLQQESTLWIWLYKKIFKKPLNEVLYYHAGMAISTTEIIEQQWAVQKDELDKILTRDIVIFRKKNLTEAQKIILSNRAIEDLGKTYDVALMIGKLLTWLTGIKWFARVVQLSDKEFCISAVADWYKYIEEDFGLPYKEEITTDILYEYLLKNVEYKVVYKN